MKMKMFSYAKLLIILFLVIHNFPATDASFLPLRKTPPSWKECEITWNSETCPENFSCVLTEYPKHIYAECKCHLGLVWNKDNQCSPLNCTADPECSNHSPNTRCNAHAHSCDCKDGYQLDHKLSCKLLIPPKADYKNHEPVWVTYFELVLALVAFGTYLAIWAIHILALKTESRMTNPLLY